MLSLQLHLQLETTKIVSLQTCSTFSRLSSARALLIAHVPSCPVTSPCTPYKVSPAVCLAFNSGAVCHGSTLQHECPLPDPAVRRRRDARRNTVLTLALYPWPRNKFLARWILGSVDSLLAFPSRLVRARQFSRRDLPPRALRHTSYTPSYPLKTAAFSCRQRPDTRPPQARLAVVGCSARPGRPLGHSHNAFLGLSGAARRVRPFPCRPCVRMCHGPASLSTPSHSSE